MIITIKYVFLGVQGMTNVEMENNARMEYVFLLEDVIHHVVQE